ncbi:MAG: DUF3427 domain-containing protein [Pyrinomonadaceae bacterium]
MNKLKVGIYDLLRTKDLDERLKISGLLESSDWTKIEGEEMLVRLSIILAREIASRVSSEISGTSADLNKEIESLLFQSPEFLADLLGPLMPVSFESLRRIRPALPLTYSNAYPDTPLGVSALLTGSSRSPALRTQLIKELATCDRADWLVSFVKFSGILHLLPTLREFTQTPLSDGAPRLRVATTSYLGATDIKAIEALLELPNTEVRVSYDTKRTRLHAKAYLFHRKTGFGSAYVGSANVSKAALDEGLEWTAKISQYETEHLWKHAVATFESHWEDESEFTPCAEKDLTTLRSALAHERGAAPDEGAISFFDLRPYGFQEVILDDIAAEREAGLSKHLVIAATGTGKTMVAAFDYKRFCADIGGRPSLLFVAHRQEILKQAQAAFRQVLRDGSFGDLVFSGQIRSQDQHLFCTVQSWNAQDFDRLPTDHFEYVVLDEAHHSAADSYQKLIDHVEPKALLGLTATPERSDGKSILDDFGGAFTHEIRLPEAINRALLSPFHYFGIPDLSGIDFSTVAWRRGGYDSVALNDMLEGNSARADWVMNQTESHVSDLSSVRGLGFCVSIAHAKFMAEYCDSKNIPALALTADSPQEVRNEAQRRLERREIRFIFTVDLYNEGVDLPFIDTVLFLRPTESLTVFLQQLGRGLRLHDEKSHLTVLDFIAPQNRNFSYAKRFQALTSRPNLRIDEQIKSDLPFVPAGCLLHLEKQAKEHVLNNIKAATANLRGAQFVSTLQAMRSHFGEKITLEQMIDYLHLDSPDEIYKKGLPSVLLERAFGRDLGKYGDAFEGFEKAISMGFRKLALADDTIMIKESLDSIRSEARVSDTNIAMLQTVIWGDKKPGDGTLSAVDQFILKSEKLVKDLVELLEWLLKHKTPIHEKRFENMTGRLNLHASYSRKQILLALGEGSFENPKASREGLFHCANRKLDVFFADINKSETDFSPTTMYDDYAQTDRLFHWQSQSQLSENTPTANRYINHREQGYTPMLFIRDRKKLSNGLTAPYFFAGPLRFRSHEGSKPISFVWELEHPLPARALSWARRV